MKLTLWLTFTFHIQSSLIFLPSKYFRMSCDFIYRCRRLDDDTTQVLLYFLLNGNPAFLSYALSRVDLDALVCYSLIELFRSPLLHHLLLPYPSPSPHLLS